MKCKNCGCEVEEGSKICDVCGENLQTDITEKPLYQNELEQLENNEKENLMTDVKEKPSILKKLGKRNIIIISVVVVVVVAIIIAIICSLNAKNAYVDEPTQEYTYEDETAESGYDEDEGDYWNSVENETTDNNEDDQENNTGYDNDSNYSQATEYIENARQQLKQGNRQTAFDLAEQAYSLCSNNDYIVQQYQYFKNYLPYELFQEKNVLSEKKHVENGAWAFVHYDSDFSSNDGEEMKNSLAVTYDYTANQELLYSLTYHFNTSYDSVQGTYYIIESAKNIEQKGYFIIYGNGQKLYTSPILGVNTLKNDFSIRLNNNIDTLVVEFYGSTKSSSVNKAIGYGINNFVALKDLP